MPEAGGSNIEIAKHLNEHEAARGIYGARNIRDCGGPGARHRRDRYCLERLSGSLWTGHQSELYGQAANCGFRPRVPPPPLTRSVCTTLQPWLSG